ncbi:MAG: TfoX/Sxy family protein [Ginsengibacter sp.]
MAYNEKLTNRLRAALAHLPWVEEKKMFGGILFMVEGKMCITVGDNEIMCRIDPSLHEVSIKRNGCRAVIMKQREYKGFVYVSEEGIQEKKDFNYWIGLALDFNKKAKASPKKKK